MSFWRIQFLPKRAGRKHVDLRYHGSKVEFIRSFFGRIVGLKKSIRLCLTFNMHNRVAGHVAMLGRSRRKDKVASLYFTISIKEQTTKSLRSIFFLNSN